MDCSQEAEKQLGERLASVAQQLAASSKNHEEFLRNCGEFDRIAQRFKDEIESTQQQLLKYSTPISTASPVATGISERSSPLPD
jgi:hypothetical protein